MSEGNGSQAGTPLPPKATHLNIKLKDDRENEVFFKVKPSTQLSKVITAYCAQQGVAVNTLRFFFDNTRIAPGDTCEQLEMEDGDMIDVHQEQQGGSAAGSPAPADEKPSHLTIRVVDQSNGETEFRLKYTTPMKKMMTAYCNSKAIQFDSVRFLHDGERMNPEDTAKSRELEDQDTIQAVLEQQGGVGSPAQEEAQPEESKHIEIRVKDQSENETQFRIKKTTPLRKVMDAYCQRSEKDRKSVRFLFDGSRVQDEDTPLSLELEDQDVIEVFLEQLGGIKMPN